MKSLGCKIKCVSLQNDRLLEKILNDEIRLADLPQKYRISHGKVYGCAFRIDGALSQRRYNEDLALLQRDIIVVQHSKDELAAIHDRMKNKFDLYVAAGLNFGKDIREL